MPQRQDSRRASVGPRSGMYLTVNFDLLLPVLVDIPDEIVHLPHQLQVAEGQFIRRHPEHVPHGRKCPGKGHRFYQIISDEQQKWGELFRIMDVHIWRRRCSSSICDGGHLNGAVVKGRRCCLSVLTPVDCCCWPSWPVCSWIWSRFPQPPPCKAHSDVTRVLLPLLFLCFGFYTNKRLEKAPSHRKADVFLPALTKGQQTHFSGHGHESITICTP